MSNNIDYTTGNLCHNSINNGNTKNCELMKCFLK